MGYRIPQPRDFPDRDRSRFLQGPALDVEVLVEPFPEHPVCSSLSEFLRLEQYPSIQRPIGSIDRTCGRGGHHIVRVQMWIAGTGRLMQGAHGDQPGDPLRLYPRLAPANGQVCFQGLDVRIRCRPERLLYCLTDVWIRRGHERAHSFGGRKYHTEGTDSFVVLIGSSARPQYLTTGTGTMLEYLRHRLDVRFPSEP